MSDKEKKSVNFEIKNQSDGPDKDSSSKSNTGITSKIPADNQTTTNSQIQILPNQVQSKSNVFDLTPINTNMNSVEE